MDPIKKSLRVIDGVELKNKTLKSKGLK